MKIVVFGAEGWTGRAVLANLKGRHEIRAAVHSTESWKQWSDIDGEWQGGDVHYGDIIDFDVVHRATEGMDAIIHLTVHFPNPSTVPLEHDQKAFLVNLKGLWNVLESARQIPVVDEVDGAARRPVIGIKLPLSAPVAPCQVARSGKPALANSVRDPNNPLLKLVSKKSGLQLQSYLVAPLLLHGSVVGVITVLNRRQHANFTSSDLALLTMLANQAAMALENAHIYEDTRGLYLDVVQAMIRAVEAKDPYTYGHSERVTKYSMVIGKALGLSPEELEELRLSALLHDIGKIGVDDNVLTKAGRLNQREWVEIRNHPALGHDILKGIGRMAQILPGVNFHHERFAGDGYPNGLSGDKIPLFGRIIAVADAYDAMTSDRAYRKRLTREAARRELMNCSGQQFDESIVKAFLAALEANSYN